MAAASPSPPRLAVNPAFAETHFIVVDFEGTTPKGAPPEPIELAAPGMQHEPGRGPVRSGFQFQSLIRPPDHAPVTPLDTAQTGITAVDVADAPDAATVLRTLAEALPRRPKVLVAHHAPVEAGIIYRYREHCPRLAYAQLICTRLLARHLWPGLTSYGLDALLAHCGIPQPADRHRALDDVLVTAGLFRHLLTEAARHHTITAFTDLIRAAGVKPRAAAPKQLELPWPPTSLRIAVRPTTHAHPSRATRAWLEVFFAIRALADSGQTVVLITHRLASVRHADLIHVLDGGRLVESGSPDQLLANGGLYAELFELQARQFVPEGAPVPSPRASRPKTPSTSTHS
ncbi:hypothetical protein GTY74_33715 [Streptomyces sp. SID8350]|nr:hypothetical protein [Streptomyces sp. SID8350]SCK61559.1 DNA polymerase III, epsilon subunit [Streptomyces sp. AmelKG-D3]